MLDLKLLQKQPEVVAAALAARHSAISLDEFLDLDRRRRAALAEVEALKSKRNTESAEVARRKKAGEDASDLVAELGVLSDRIKALDVEAEALKDEVAAWMLNVPNIPDASVPVGKDETENVEANNRNFPSPPRNTGNWARPSTAWTSNGRADWPERAFPSRADGPPGLSGRL